ncbi:hypothetical protein OG271_03815 [Micromonospora rifamycinica]|uniref:hypothetical protein n=1 Tax=Micromonospora rifamycinica TaxID=291594 RepID=UPI002E27D095|nr:hypothetical protein [Micromonospora rifamycinica]
MSQITTTTGSLAKILGAVTPFVSRDVTLPALNCVQLRAADGVLAASGTDRYVIGHARQPATGQPTGPLHLARWDAKRLRRELTAFIEDRETAADEATITQGGEFLTVTFRGVTMHLRQAEGKNYPDLEKILSALPTHDAEGLHAPVGLTHRVIRPLLKAAELDPFSSPRWTFDGPRKPVRVEIGDWFIAVLMPVKLQGDEQPVSVEMPGHAAAEAVAR